MLDLSVRVAMPNTALFRGEGSRVVTEELVAATEFGVNAIQADVIPRTPVNQGLLRNAWQTKVNPIGDGLGVLGLAFNPMGYSLPVETGSRPHFPPVAPLILWAQRKFSVTDKEARSIGFLVARAISRRGTPPVEMARKAIDSVRGAIEARFNKAVATVIERLGR
jgi:hypothetical protein